MAKSESHTKWSKRHQLGVSVTIFPPKEHSHASVAPSSTTSITTAPSSTIIPPPSHCNNSHDPVTPSSISAPPPLHSDDGHFDIAPANSDHVPTASQPHEAPQTQPYVPLQSEETMEEEQTPSVPSIGTWSKPLVLKLSLPFIPY
ncbi:hypothetical protein F2Q70_00021440 [Brassica cretica]|uniref:Uncharacterized protein n=2 Tax=Brassica cretica TaxID=69181 RepID=A0A8S9GPD2_BRACR|nr:hypothetical protein F2Q70_00021440 [Brassica cretica]KAF2560072.1 hypothetical protein F2Q68_00014991 [Brassica cretica]KAF3610298.1 hypothetical protein DY000_02047733 [Brassica cretica]